MAPNTDKGSEPKIQYLSVLVIGAGELGLAVLNALAQHGHFDVISVLLRPSNLTLAAKDDSDLNHDELQKAESIRKIMSLGIKPVRSDFVSDSIDTLARIFAPFHTIIGCSGFAHGAAGVQVKLAQAVLQAASTGTTLKRYIPWQFGVDYDILGAGSTQDLFDEQLAVRRLLRAQSAVEMLIVSVGIFRSFLLSNPAFGIIDSSTRTVRGLGSWDTRITVTDADDIGKLTAGILFEREEHPELERGDVVHIAGDTLSYGQLADMVQAANPKWLRELWTHEHLAAELAADPENGLKKYRPVFASERGIAWEVATSWNGRRGVETKDVKSALSSELAIGS